MQEQTTTPTTADYQQKVKERAELIEKLHALQGEVANRNKTHAGGRRFTDREYWQWRSPKIAEILHLQGEIAKTKAWLHQNNHLNVQPRKAKELGKLDEFDLANALSEPQTLLHRAYARLFRLCSSRGWSEDDRALIESIHEYLWRQGIVLDQRPNLKN